MHSITYDVEKIVGDSGLSNGLCQLSVLHTSASLLIQENAS
ncbi:MAG: YjbQ family protein, partial [Gammaproteobacteria bacterium]